MKHTLIRFLRRLFAITPNELWLTLFACWILFLSGIVAGIVGTPGVIQAVRLRSLLYAKESQVHQMEAEVRTLDAERERLIESRVAQEREIRRVLGYAASDEIIFDFASTERLGD